MGHEFSKCYSNIGYGRTINEALDSYLLSIIFNKNNEIVYISQNNNQYWFPSDKVKLDIKLISDELNLNNIFESDIIITEDIKCTSPVYFKQDKRGFWSCSIDKKKLLI